MEAKPSLNMGSDTQTIHVITTAAGAIGWAGECAAFGSVGRPAAIAPTATAAMPMLMIQRADEPRGIRESLNRSRKYPDSRKITSEASVITCAGRRSGSVIGPT